MDEQKQAVLEKIAKLLSLSADQEGKPEGILAREMASKLMAKHRIAESEIDMSSKSADDVFEDEDGWDGLCDQGGKRQWVADLAWWLADTFDARMYLRAGTGTIHFLGTLSDIETCLYFQDVVYSHIEKAARKMYPKPDEWKKRNVFGQAAMSEVSNRLYEMKKAMQDEIRENYSGGTELMILKNDIVKKTVDDLFKDRGMGPSRNSSVNSNDQRAISAGRAAGRTAPLNRAIQA